MQRRKVLTSPAYHLICISHVINKADSVTPTKYTFPTSVLCYFSHLNSLDVYLFKIQSYFCKDNHTTSIYCKQLQISFFLVKYSLNKTMINIRVLDLHDI
jgi:hypothetical protein